MSSSTDNAVLVHQVTTVTSSLKAGQYTLVRAPSMRLDEDGTRFLARLAQTSGSDATGRNNAYALAYWFSHCLARDVDPKNASLDDVIQFKTDMEAAISAHTAYFGRS